MPHNGAQVSSTVGNFLHPGHHGLKEIVVRMTHARAGARVAFHMLNSLQMSFDAWVTAGVAVTMVVLMGLNVAGPDLILIGGLTALLVSGVVTPGEAFIGFSSPAVVTIGALFVVAGGIRETGGLDFVARRVLGRPRTLARAQLRLMYPVGALSAFMNNTPVVAMFVPLVTDWARRSQQSVSMLLMPLSYAAILGGTCTLIGTSTNLVVAGMASAREPDVQFAMFDIAWLGLPALLLGTIYVTVTSRWLLKDRKGTSQMFGESREYTVAMRVEKTSPVIGQTIEDAGLRSLDNLYLYQIERNGDVLPAVPPSTKIRSGDRLRFTGIVDSVVDLRKMGLLPDTDQVDKLVGRKDRRWVEAVVSAQSPLAGKSVRQTKFRTRYNAAIIAVHRQGMRIPNKVGDITLEAGDVLLLESHPTWARSHRRDTSFALVSEVEDSQPPRHDKAALASAILVIVVVVNVLGLMPLATASLVGAGAMLITRCLNGAQARRALEVRVLLAVGSALGFGLALDQSGAATRIGEAVVTAARAFGPIGVLGAIYASTALLAGIVSTTAAAALMFPIAASAAQVESIELVPLSYVVMIAASTAFSTPIGYQTNLMVLGPGGYRSSDFLRLGLPLQVIIGCTTVFIAYWRWL